MKYLTLRTPNNKIDVMHANSWWLRLRGLLGRKLSADEAMLIEPCNSVHTFWMKYNLDIVYISSDNEIVKIITNMKPWSFSACRRANKTLELPANTANTINLKKGDKMKFEKEVIR